MTDSNLSPDQHCTECGMPVPNVQHYHPYAACLMFKACHDSRTVEANLDGVKATGYQIALDAKDWESQSRRIVELEQQVKDQARARIMADAEHARQIAELERENESLGDTVDELKRGIEHHYGRQSVPPSAGLDAEAIAKHVAVNFPDTWEDEDDFRVLLECLVESAIEARQPSPEPDSGHEAAIDALLKIRQWAEAYPLSVFPEPDFKKVGEVLKAAGLSLDQVSASNMRHVITQVGSIAEQALPRETGDSHD